MANNVNMDRQNIMALRMEYRVHNKDVITTMINPLNINPLDNIQPSKEAVGLMISKMQ
jgi:hypothetical protein